MANFNGSLNSNEVFSALYNMILSQEVFADNIADAGTSLVDKARVDGSMYGDTKLYYSADVLKSAPWGKDAAAQNLLALHRPEAPKCQKITLNVFRQIALTVDEYLSKRAWSTEGAFAQFTSVMQSMLGMTKRVYDATTYNAFVGTAKSVLGKQAKTITLPTNTDAEAQARQQASAIAEAVANILVDVKDITRDYNDNCCLRSFDPSDLIVIWNSEQKNKIKCVDMPTIYHNDGLFDKVDEEILPARYFGDVNATSGTTGSINITVRSLIEKDYAVGASTVHVLPGDLLPLSTAYLANETYTVNPKIICKIIHKKSIPYMSSFECGTSFYNPMSLTTNHYLTYGRNTLEYLKNYPMITLAQS